MGGLSEAKGIGRVLGRCAGRPPTNAGSSIGAEHRKGVPGGRGHANTPPTRITDHAKKKTRGRRQFGDLKGY